MANYTEEDLLDAFLCGVKEGASRAVGEDAAQDVYRQAALSNWKDRLFYWGFDNDALFSGPGYNKPKK